MRRLVCTGVLICRTKRVSLSEHPYSLVRAFVFRTSIYFLQYPITPIDGNDGPTQIILMRRLVLAVAGGMCPEGSVSRGAVYLFASKCQ